MARNSVRLLSQGLGVFAWLCASCTPGGVGDPCTPEDEYSDTLSGFSVSEVSTESASFQCETRLCLVNHFQGRVSCPYGQTSEQAATDPRCHIPGSDEPVRASVLPQLAERRAHDSVYCSCRCAGPEPEARYCECPAGFSCEPVVPHFTLGRDQLPGSYCIRLGSAYDSAAISSVKVCDAALHNCEK